MFGRNTRALYFIHGRGRGHASRASVVYRALQERGFDTNVFAGGDAEDHLNDAAIPFARRAPLLPSPTSIVELVQRTYADVDVFKRNRPALVVSDGDHAALLAARRLGIPSLAIGHDLIFDASVNLPRLPTRALVTQRLNSLPTRVATRRIAVHFLPTRSHSPKLSIARPDTACPSAEDCDGSILCYFRDNNGAHITSQLCARGFRVNWYTSHAVAVPGVNVLPPSVSGFRAALQRCRAVVTSAGSNVLADCVAQHKPVLALYRQGDTEQQLNALLIEHSNVGAGATFDGYGAPLEHFLNRVNGGGFAAIDLHSLLPPLSRLVRQTLDELAAQSPEMRTE